MPPDDRKYVRVYYNDLIRDYPDVWGNDAALASWLRMLATADPMWPTPPELPRSVRAKPLASLTKATLVEVLPTQRYRMKGLDAERTRRQDAGRNAAAMRWHDVGNADGNAKPMPSKAKQSKDEQSRADVRADDDLGDDALDTYWQVMGSYPTGRSKTWIVELVNEFDEGRVSRAIAAESKGERQGLLGRARDRLRSEAEATAKARALASQARLDAEATAKRITPEQAAEMRRRTQEELARMLTPAKAAS